MGEDIDNMLSGIYNAALALPNTALNAIGASGALAFPNAAINSIQTGISSAAGTFDNANQTLADIRNAADTTAAAASKAAEWMPLAIVAAVVVMVPLLMKGGGAARKVVRTRYGV